MLMAGRGAQGGAHYGGGVAGLVEGGGDQVGEVVITAQYWAGSGGCGRCGWR